MRSDHVRRGYTAPLPARPRLRTLRILAFAAALAACSAGNSRPPDSAVPRESVSSRDKRAPADSQQSCLTDSSCTYEAAWPGCSLAFVPNARDIVGAEDLLDPQEPAGSSELPDTCPTPARSCEDFLTRNQGRDGRSIATSYIAHSLIEARCFMESVPCDVINGAGPPRLGYYARRTGLAWVDKSVVEYEMECIDGTARRKFLFDVSTFYGSDCYPDIPEGADPCTHDPWRTK